MSRSVNTMDHGSIRPAFPVLPGAAGFAELVLVNAQASNEQAVHVSDELADGGQSSLTLGKEAPRAAATRYTGPQLAVHLVHEPLGEPVGVPCMDGRN